MAYLSSANVKVYPCAYRGNGYDPEARLTSEKNLTSLINAFGARYYDESTVKDSSFVISWANPKIKFVIGGYIFEADLTGQLTADNIYAHIRVNDRNTPSTEATDWKCTSLVDFSSGSTIGTLDDNNSFGGLLIDNNPTAANATSDLHILYKYQGSYAVPATSIARVSSYYVGQANEIAGTIYYNPIDVAFTTASLTAGNATVGGTLGVSGAATLASLSVTGNATVGGTLGVTGATTFTGAVTANSTFSVTGATTLSGDTFLNATANKSTTILNGAIVLGLGGSGGTIEANGNAEFRGSQGVKTDKLASTGQEPITLASNIMPSGNIGLGAQSDPFQTIFSNGFYVPITSGDSMSMHKDTTGSSYPNGGILESAGTLHLRATSNLHLDGSNNNSKIYSEKKFIANDGIESLGDIKSLGDITIAANKHLDLSGDSTGSIKLKTVTGTSSSTSYTITSGDGIYNITIKVNNDAYSATMALKDFSPVYSPNFTYNGSTRIGASKNGTDWVLTFTYAGDWKVVKIASL